MRVLRRARPGMLCMMGTAFVFFCAALHAQTPPALSPTWQELLARADSLHGVAQFDSSLLFLEHALDIAERDYGTEDTNVARVLHGMSIVEYELGRYANAEPLCRRALAIRERALGSNHPDVAKSLNVLGNVCFIQGRYKETEPLHRRALEIREYSLGSDHPDVAMSLINLSNLFDAQSSYHEAEVYCRRALDIFERTQGAEHTSVALALNNLGNICRNMGRYADAEPLQLRALAIREKNLGYDHPEVARSLSALGALYADEGRLADAQPLYQRSLTIYEKVLGSDHPDLTWALSNLANIYVLQGNPNDAEPLVRRMLTIREMSYKAEHPDVASALNALGYVLILQERYAEAESLLKRAVEIQEKTLRPGHPVAAWSLDNLAALCLAQNRNAEAESLSERALQLRERALGSEHPQVADALSTHATVAQLLGDSLHAKESASRAWNIRLRNFHDGVGVLADRNALEYSQFLSRETSIYLAILAGTPDGLLINSAEITHVVFSTKSQVTDGIMARNRATVQETDPELVTLADSLKLARFALSDLFVSGPDDEHPEAFKSQLQSVTIKKERWECELARRSASFAHEQVLWDIGAVEVSESLPSGTTLVEFMKYEHLVSFGDTELRYLAIVIKSNGESSVFSLGAASAIDTAVYWYRQQFRNPQALDQTAYSTAAENLYSLVWRPLAALLTGATTVFIAPDGDLNLVSFAGLMDENGQYLSEKYPIHYLSTGRDLIRLRDSAPAGSGLLAMGDPDFDLSPAMSTASAVGLALLTSLNLRSSCEVLSKLNVPRLPGTRNEAEAVAARWTSGGTPAATYLGAEATEENFKQNTPGKQIIHLATHGFYISEECQTKLNARRSLGMQEGGYVGENPLLLSGFLLAGANKHGEGATEAKREDGIVTAEEVAGLNLNGTDLVVLSACETGLGEVKSGEGVYGLRRAFQMAGARTVISALWPIDDQATAEFMGQLFSAQNEDLPHVMQRIALSRITTLRSQGKSDHPFYWAGFVATGDWKTH